MKPQPRYLFSLALAALVVYVLGAGCTQNFGAFKPCKPDEKVCGEGCVAVTDPAYGCSATECAPCGIANATAACQASACAVDSCNGAFQDCDGTSSNGCEVNTSTDPKNCGACGNACVIPHGQPGCKSSLCAVGSCDAGWDDCNGDPTDGCEAQLDSDPGHCGSCTTTCPPFQQCIMGQCELVCDPGKGDCDMDPDNGCETTFGTTDNCGACNDACDLANATSACDAGKCVIEKCKSGFEDCDGADANGCEADLKGSAMHCGACDRACDTTNVATATCSNGTCSSSCKAGFGNCDKPEAPAPDDGCETDVSNDLQNCGSCNKVCSPAHATGTCVAGMCKIDSCMAPFADCNGGAMDGCETNTTTSVANCGGCGNACNLPNAVEGCAAGMCTVASCNAGFGNCDGMAANGCEKNVNADTANCGACGRACNSTNTAALACAGGLCTSTCKAGFGNCSQPAAPGADDGCETNTDTNVNNCGACGRACSGNNVAFKSCSAGVCDSECNLGSANCSMPAAPTADNGCELNVATSSTNCGGCGNNCAMQGGANNKFACDGGVALQQYCGCSSNNECQGTGVGSGASGGQCNASGLCSCNSVTCNQAEACILSGGVAVCSCNGGAACAAGQTCCQTPTGCKDLQTDAQNCGACGHACAGGRTCVNGACQ